jgi:hypothetical protein
MFELVLLSVKNQFKSLLKYINTLLRIIFEILNFSVTEHYYETIKFKQYFI